MSPRPFTDRRMHMTEPPAGALPMPASCPRRRGRKSLSNRPLTASPIGVPLPVDSLILTLPGRPVGTRLHVEEHETSRGLVFKRWITLFDLLPRPATAPTKDTCDAGSTGGPVPVGGTTRRKVKLLL
ncbi:hypothetical protein GALMADRAFT_1260650 [Galerina marginata CBS 339.88]|uniref:Uncharacterized protein n=1 Tax=Galerina marginata (strain CBS 339.88) TaxID=685588 RepID=A0A067T688_GALM3|nr:hypothetical protein GALMADRAFT_1260650 [Galerina marginata CBS 339.88]